MKTQVKSKESGLKILTLGEESNMSENDILSKELMKLFDHALVKATPHKVEGHGFEVQVKLEGAGEIRVATTPPAIIAGGGGGGVKPPRKPRGVTRAQVDDVLKGFQGSPLIVEETATHILVKPDGYLADAYGPLKDAFVKMCGSHEPWVKDNVNKGRDSHWAFPKEG